MSDYKEFYSRKANVTREGKVDRIYKTSVITYSLAVCHCEEARNDNTPGKKC